MLQSRVESARIDLAFGRNYNTMKNMDNRYTDEEILRILRERRCKKRRKKIITRCSILVAAALFVVLGLYKLTSGLVAKLTEEPEPYGIIFLDPGHGGVDSGTDAGGRYEKDDTLKLSLAVRDCLKEAGYTVYMSRTEDVDVDREKRGELANSKNADLFISFHRNQSNGEGDGAEIWLPKDNSKEARILGRCLMDAFVECGFAERSITPGVYKNPNEDYYENSVPKMTSCLAEVGFTSSSKDNRIFDKVDTNAPIIAEAIIKAHRKIFPGRYEEE